MSPALGHWELTSVQSEVFGEALLKQEYFSIIELEIQGTVDTLLKEIENYLTSETVTKNFNREISVHTVTVNTDKSHAGLMQSMCLKNSYVQNSYL